jgi:MSHA biogenesis protein MshL
MVLFIKQTLTEAFWIRTQVAAAAGAVAFILAGCGAQPVAKPEGHLQPEAVSRTAAAIPTPVRALPMPPPPAARDAEVKYSVMVTNQPVREVLLAMARETKVNFDIHPGIEGSVTLNALDQTLRQVLTRIARQVDMRWEADGDTITVMPDTPYLRNYKVDYVNMARDVTGVVGVQNQVVPPIAGVGAGASQAQNSSLLKVENSARNRFWETLERNIKDMLRETDKLLPEGSSETFVQNRGQSAIATNQSRTIQKPRAGTASTTRSGTTVENPGETAQRETSEFVEQRLTFREAASVIVNAETGIVSVRATSRQHEKVSEFISQVTSAARRQVLIEATVVEVRLSDRYQSGVDWSALGLNGLGYTIRQNFITPDRDLANASNPFFSIQYRNPRAAVGGDISSTIKLLDQFGRTRVLSSPRIMAVNNQTAVLKVVDNLVYFTVKVTPAVINQSGTVTSPATYETTPQLVPVGFIMNVTPQIADNDLIVLNVRPTVTTKVDDVRDPNPALGTTPNFIPVIRSREFESVLRIPSGSTAVLGGLMEDSFTGDRAGLPILSRVPVFGDAVSYRDDTSLKRELVVFLRPLVIRDASVEGDLAAYRKYLPADDFFRDTHPPLPGLQENLRRIERGEAPRFERNPVVPETPAGGIR